MRLFKSTSTSLGILIGLILMGVIGLARVRPALGMDAAQVEDARALLPQLTPTAPPASKIYLPLTANEDPLPEVELLASWIVDSSGTPKTVFLPYEDVKYTIYIGNNTASDKWATIGWTQSGPCGETVVESQSVKFPPGITKHEFANEIANCQGIQANVIEVTYKQETSAINIQHIVTSPFQSFDMCSLPTAAQMQTWWSQSPYYTINLYIGGDSLACKPPNLNSTWLSQVSPQGWTFTLTWVGLQAPCTGFNHRMSWNAGIAEYEGRVEADKAVAAAKALGFESDHIIYYDMEGYASQATATCKAAVDAFMQGWVERIHELGFRAGAYGGACSSLVADWWDNASPPDDVWLAHWYISPYFYNRDAHVWNTPCVANSLWPKNQRLKQYVGDHKETWGGVGPFTIDSNVLDGEVATYLASSAAQDNLLPGFHSESSAVPAELPANQAMRAMDLLSPQAGWVLHGERLLWTEDGGASWQDRTPEGLATDHILGVDFLDASQGWLARQTAQADSLPVLSVLRTTDGGASWQASPLPLSPEDAFTIAAASPHFIDSRTGWIALKVQSGINFSLGRLFATQDGGVTWQERTLPLGEPVRFVDRTHGWVVGGPSGEQLFHTLDGGVTWQAQSLPLPDPAGYEAAYLGLPQFTDALHGRLPVTLAGSEASQLALFETSDGGATWHLAARQALDASTPPASALPFSLEASGGWWAAAGRLYRAATGGNAPVAQSAAGLTGDVLALDFADGETGWVLAQEGSCTGTKLAHGERLPPGYEPLRCQLSTRLLTTSDGGSSWSELSLDR